MEKQLQVFAILHCTKWFFKTISSDHKFGRSFRRQVFDANEELPNPNRRRPLKAIPDIDYCFEDWEKCSRIISMCDYFGGDEIDLE